MYMRMHIAAMRVRLLPRSEIWQFQVRVQDHIFFEAKDFRVCDKIVQKFCVCDNGLVDFVQSRFIAQLIEEFPIL